MFDCINAISLEGWGHLLTALLPMNPWLAVTDLVLFFVLPLCVVLGLVSYFRKHIVLGSKGAWRASGAVWAKCFWVSMLGVIVGYFLAHDVLTRNISDVESFEVRYRKSLPGYSQAKGTRAVDHEVAIARELSAERTRHQGECDAEVGAPGSPEYCAVSFFYQEYGYIHPFLPALADMLFMCWFFWPGFKMKKQGIKL